MTKKILIIDDDRIFSKILKDGITAGGQGKYEVITAVDGEEGLQVASKEKPDLILLDMMMPKLPGMEALRRLRSEDWGKNIPVIISTSVSDLGKMSEGLELDARGYIIKSDYSMETILKRIDEVLK